MKNRDVEVNILNYICSKNNKFNVYSTNDFKFINMNNLKMPRIVSKTISNSIIATLNNKQNKNNDYVDIGEITTHKHIVQLTFVLDKNVNYADVEEIRKYLHHKLATRHYFLLNGLDMIIQKVGDIIDISDHRNSNYIERYSIDLEITTVEKCIEEIEIVKNVKYEVDRR